MNKYDMVIAGGGPAGLTAATYASRAKLSVLVAEKLAPGGQVLLTERIENYPGFESIPGYELAEKMEHQARGFGAEIVTETVSAARKDGSRVLVTTETREIEAGCMIAATGTEPRVLGVPGEKELRGKGVSYCATCDGPFFAGKKIAVLGGGNSAVEEGIYLTKFAEQVFLIHRRDKLRAVRLLQERALANKKIAFLWDSVLEEVEGNNSVSQVRLKNLKTGERTELKVDGVFIYAGMLPRGDFLPESVRKDEAGYIVTDDKMETSEKGIFAAGDVRQKLVRQIATAVGDGTMAAVAAGKYLEEET
ncbi:MAG: thioredoxin-disulfide reductase [Candidatus Eisenbacteria bacterium]|nr:thioredoxin-disulfide reductase [Candidatus Eisenbacteria bacterium]